MSLVDTYNNVKEALKDDGISWLKTLQTCHLTVKSNRIENAQAWTALTAFNPTQGWIQTLDKTHVFENNQVFKNLIDTDNVLNAECINPQGHSLHLRATGQQLIATTFFPVSKEAENKNTQYLSAKYTQILDQQGTPSNQQIMYKVYWHPDNTSQPAYSRFIRIEDIKNVRKGAK